MCFVLQGRLLLILTEFLENVQQKVNGECESLKINKYLIFYKAFPLV